MSTASTQSAPKDGSSAPSKDKHSSKAQSASHGARKKQQLRNKRFQDLHRTFQQVRAPERSEAEQLASVFWNPTAATREIHMTYVDFFDVKPLTTDGTPYRQYKADTSSFVDLDGIAPGTTAAFSRITGFKLWALPRTVNAGVAGAVVAVLFGLPVQPGSASSTTTGGTAATKTTILTPTSVSDWVLVGEWNEKTLATTSQVLDINGTGFVALGSFAVCDPDDFNLITYESESETGIQFMAEVSFAQTIPNVVNVAAGVSAAADVTVYTSTTGGSLSTNPMMIEACSVKKAE